MKRRREVIFILFVFLIFSLMSCGKSEKGEIVATVNGVPIRLNDLKYNIALRSSRDPDLKITPQLIEDELNILIEKKLMVQEALEKGIMNDERFIRTIKNYWVQTIIKYLMDLKKNTEWRESIIVQEKEIENYYRKMQYNATLKFVKAKDKTEADRILKKAQKGEFDNWDGVLGPVAFEDVFYDFRDEAFDMAEGETKLFTDDNEDYVVSMVKKESAPQPPIKDLYQYIKSTLTKEKSLFIMQDWINDSREKAEISINEKMVNNFVNTGST